MQQFNPPPPPQILANTPLEARSQTQVGSQRFSSESNPDMKYFEEYFKSFFFQENARVFLEVVIQIPIRI